MPIYRGNPLINQELNRHSFINCHDYPDLEAVVVRVVQLDQDDAFYKKVYEQPWLLEQKSPWSSSGIEAFIERILASAGG